MNTIKSIGAVIAGFVTVVILSIGTDAILEKSGIFPSPQNGLFITWMLVLALVYRCVYTVLGGYITARLAPDRPYFHARILAIIGLFGGAAGIVAGWDLSAHWYPIAIFISAYPLTVLGGKLYVRKL